VLLWFVGGAATIVWLVFRDPRFDFRLLAVGALLPDAVDVLLGGARALHSVLAPIAVLVAVMLATLGRRPIRRRLLAVPIGMFLHLVLDGVFRDTRVFWWPLTGLSLPDAPLPSAARGWWNVPLELVGLLLLVRLAPLVRRGEPGSVREC
jgi:hypothetical protein